MLIREVFKNCTKELKTAGISNSDIDAKIIISYALNIDYRIFYCTLDKKLDESTMIKIIELIELRKKRYPLQYIIGEWDFHDVNLIMREGVFIPRPETEIIVEYIISQYEDFPEDELYGLEIGIGSGAISISLLRRLQNLRMIASDISDDALSLSAENAQINHIQNRIEIIKSDLYKNIPRDKKFDFIVSNPPYIDPALKPSLQPELKFEPDLALYTPKNGKKAPSEIIKEASDLLKPNGSLFLEIADYNSKSLFEIADKLFMQCILLQDNNLKNRFIIASHLKK